MSNCSYHFFWQCCLAICFYPPNISLSVICMFSYSLQPHCCLISLWIAEPLTLPYLTLSYCCVDRWVGSYPIFMAYKCSLYTFPQLLLFSLFKTVVVVHCSIVFGLFLTGLSSSHAFAQPWRFFNIYLSIARYMGSSWRKMCFGKPPHPWS